VPSIHTNRGIGRARKARLALGLALDRPLEDVVEAVERDGVHVVVLDLGHGVAGAYLRRRERPMLFVNGRQGLARQRFTVAHEFGHHRLGHHNVVDAVAALTDTGHDPQEVEANAFAAEFLMPRDAVEVFYRYRLARTLSLDEVVRIAHAFGVSAQMARYRLASHGVLVDQDLCDRLDAEIAEDLHIEVAERLGLDESDDLIATAAADLPRVPDALRTSAFGQFLAGDLAVDTLAQSLGRSPVAVERMLANLGLREVATAS
jgi:Zn-dependent peptidase ImmA (M78 family)